MNQAYLLYDTMNACKSTEIRLCHYNSIGALELCKVALYEDTWIKTLN